LKNYRKEEIYENISYWWSRVYNSKPEVIDNIKK